MRAAQGLLPTCKQPPVHACYYPGYVWAAPSSEASGTCPEADWQPSGHNDLMSSKWWTAPRLFYQTDTGRGGEWAQASMGSCPACSLGTEIGSVPNASVLLFWKYDIYFFLPILTFSYSPKHEDARLFNHPVRMEEQFFQQGQNMEQQFIPEHIGQHIQSRRWTLTWCLFKSRDMQTETCRCIIKTWEVQRVFEK